MFSGTVDCFQDYLFILELDQQADVEDLGLFYKGTQTFRYFLAHNGNVVPKV